VQSMSGVFSIASHWALQYLPFVTVQEQMGCAHFCPISGVMPSSCLDPSVFDSCEIIDAPQKNFCANRNTLDSMSGTVHKALPNPPGFIGGKPVGSEPEILGRTECLGPFALARPLLSAQEEEGRTSGDKHDPEDCQYGGVPVFLDERDDLAPVARGQVCQGGVSDQPAKSESGQEFFGRVLHRARGKEKRSHGNGRRQQSRDGNGSKSPTAEYFVNLFRISAREPAFECFLATFTSQPVCDKTSEQGTRRGHECVVKPPLLLARRQ
jgi:hypothetical protein